MNLKKIVVVVASAALILSAGCNRKPESEENIQVTLPEGPGRFEDTASSSVKVFDQNGRVCIQQTSTYYELVNAYDGGSKIPLLLKITKTDLCFADSVNKDKVYQISAKSIMDTKTVEWETDFVATDINFKDNSNTLLAIHEGNDGEEDLLTRFSLLNGKEVFSCSYGDLRIAVPNVKDKRFFGYTSRIAVTNPVKAKKEENLIGLITYSSSREKKNTVQVKLKRSTVASSIPDYTPEMVLVASSAENSVIEDGKSLILMKANEKYTSADVRNFGLKLTYYYGDDREFTEIFIPVENDKVILSKANFDGDIFELSE